MLREWATVIDWQQGIATLRCEQRSGCSSCQSQQTCGTRVLNKLGPQVVHDLKIPVSQPLSIGQRVELGIPESGVLLSALLVYIVPLLGILLCASVFYSFAGSDIAAVLGALIGGGLGFMLARFYAAKLATHASVHPIVLQIAIPAVNSTEH
ncbi:SoxR-reducing system protein RseC [Pragia fontium]|uniref:Positive regulator of sigma(E), RseC/MucC n=2 Tax=Pragia fontium TaxID=82985 RepID=A0AAJ4W7B3_9GAMM|nr:SoxR-reducing system protein RseC [Pragia fontium]AKJ41579.1 SoxR reducing system protein RseC [Pragia fontium]SFB95161.1 positive regulator of sigma(E), RseC/MucC [Pragia fontium DSM 5563 = ATCC 49100]SUB81797.1 Sigma-E factor regulatory protein rseC [Pragia fontium]VEJ54345.1 Sigma-E factor regulatory protein rseC [Pragia fontium]GKX63096.1 SoxR reducing system protein RseC [Pragia fontium]